MARNYRFPPSRPKRADRPGDRSWWPGMGESSSGTPWGRVTDAIDTIISHANATPSASILLAAANAGSFVNMHSACEHFLPQAGATRTAGVWFFPSKARLRIARVADVADAARISDRQFSLIAVIAEGEVIKLLEPLLTHDGVIIPFLGNR